MKHQRNRGRRIPRHLVSIMKCLVIACFTGICFGCKEAQSPDDLLKSESGGHIVSTKLVGTPGEAELGAPIYPGAVPLTGGGALGHFGRDANGFVSALFLTPDDQQRVEDYYEDRLSIGGQKPPKKEWFQGDRRAVLFTMTTSKSTVTVGIHIQEDNTAIEIMNIPKSMSAGASTPLKSPTGPRGGGRLDQVETETSGARP